MASVNFNRKDWTVETLGDFLAQQQENNEDRVKSIYERDQSTHRAQLDGINKRLETVTDLYNRSIENNLRAVSREEFERAINAGRERLEETTGPIIKQLSETGKPNWMLLVGFMSVALVVLSGCWLLIGLQINVAITPQALTIEATRAANAGLQLALNGLEARVRAAEVATTQSAAADAESRLDRTRLNQRAAAAEEAFSAHVAEGKANTAGLRSQLVEIETQFCAGDTARNLMHASDMRITSMLWSKVNPGAILPTDNAFYPSICNRSAAMTNIAPSSR
jgi:hypothetical protein